MDNTKPEIRLSYLGESALLLDAAASVFRQDVQERIWALSESVTDVPGVLEAVPGMNNLMIVFEPLKTDVDELQKELRVRWDLDVANRLPGTIIEIPTVYGGTSGEDLAEIASLKGVGIKDIVELHSSAIYTVAAVGAMPGFVYLSGLDPALSTPRRTVPRGRVEKGSVIIGGAQAGIMPVTAPSGWHILGHTSTVLFDETRSQPATFKPGDRIKFIVEAVLS